MAPEPMQGNRASSPVDLGYTELFPIPAVTIKQIKAPYVFDGEHGIALQAMQGNQASFAARGSLMVFPGLRLEPGEYSRDTAGMAI